MAIELEKLLFSVDTAELDTALKKIDALSEKLDTLTTATNKTNKASNDSAKTLKNSTTETNKATDAQNQLNESTSKANAILDRQKDILKFQTEGFSKGQSSVLAYAKATGAATGEIKELGNVLQMQRKLIGGDPFDKSISGLVALQNQYGEIREAMRQYSKDTELTRNQTRELTRDKERIIEKMKLEGATFSQIKNAIKAHNDEYIRTANLVNNLTNQEKMLERAQKDKLNALRSIQAAEERVRATLVALNAETEDSTKLNERAALAVGAYERNLRVAGVSADEAAKRLKNFKEQQAEVTKATQRNQMDYLARGIGVQMGDIGVSLASGMNPLTVAVQQFDQIRGLIQQTGATAQEMNAVMSQAVAQIVSSFKLLGVAVGSFVTGAIKSLGEYATTWTGVNKALQLAQDNMLITEATSMRLNKAIGTVLAGSLGVIITLSAAFVIASKQMLDANNALDRSLAQFGATLGITSKEAHALAQSQTELGVTSATATNALADFAKSGITDVGMLEAALQSAIKTQKILGVSTEDTAKIFADLRKKPTETLIEIAKNTGLVNAETIKYVHTLEEQGKTQEAVAIAQGAVLASMEGVRQVADVNLTEVEKLWRDIKNAISEVWGAMQNLSQNTDFWKGVRDLFAKLKLIAVQTMNVIAGVGLDIRDALSLDFNSDRINGFINEQNQKAADEYEATMRNIYNATSQNAEAEKKSATERQKNSEAASKLAEQFKKDKENKAKADKEAERILKEYNKDLDEFAKLIAEAYGEQERLTKSEMKMMEIIRSDYWNKYTKDQKIAILQAYDLAKATELVTDRIKAQADSMKSWTEVTKELQQQNVEMQKRSTVIDNEVQLLGLAGVEREKALRQIELQNKYASAQERFDKNQLSIIKKYREEQEKASKLTSEENRNALYAQNAAAYEDAMKQAEELLSKERDVANKEVNKSIAESYYKEMQRVSDMLADVLITALTEGGKAGSKKLGDYIKKELLSASSMFISSIIRAQLGNFMQSAFGINASNFQGGTLASNLAGTASSAYNTFTGGQGLTGSLYSGFAMSGVGQSLGLSGTVGLSGIEGFGAGVGGAIPEVAMTGLGSSIGAALPYIGLGLTAVSLLGDMFSSGGAPKSMLGGGGRISAGKASYDPTGQMHWTDYTYQDKNLATSIISDQLVQALKKINSSYSAGAYVKGEINVKGSSSNQMLASATNEAGNLIYHFFQETGKGIEDFNKFVQEQVPKIQLALVVDAMRSSGEDYKEIANLIVGDSDNLTESLKDVSQEGIVAMQSSLSSAMQAFETANNIFEKMGASVSATDFKKASEAVGGFENLNSLLNSYYDKFYSEEEKRINLMQSIVDTFNAETGSNVSLQQVMNMTKQDFRNLYEESVRLHGIANPTALAMLKVSDAFSQVATSAENVATSAENVAQSERKLRLERERALEQQAREILVKSQEIYKNLTEPKEQQAEVRAILSGISDIEYESVKEFGDALGQVNLQLKELEKLNIGGIFKKQVQDISQSIKDSIYESVAKTRLDSGDFTGAIQAVISTVTLPEGTGFDAQGNFNAGTFNKAYSDAQFKKLTEYYTTATDYASKNALHMQNIRDTLTAVRGGLDGAIKEMTKQQITSSTMQQFGEEVGTVISNAISPAIEAIATNAGARQGQGTQGLAMVYSAQAQVGSFSRALQGYNSSIRNLNTTLDSGKITAEEYKQAMQELDNATGMGWVKEATEAEIASAQAAAAAAEAANLFNSSLQSLNFYFSDLTKTVDALGEAAKKAGEPIGKASNVIGLLNSAVEVFGKSAEVPYAAVTAIMKLAGLDKAKSKEEAVNMQYKFAEDYSKAGNQSAFELSNIAMLQYSLVEQFKKGSLPKDKYYGQNLGLGEGTYMSSQDVWKTLSGKQISEAANKLAQSITTATAEATKQMMQSTELFNDLSAEATRDVALLTEGVTQFDADGLYNAFLRLSDALGQGVINSPQYDSLINHILGVYQGVSDKVAVDTKQVFDDLLNNLSNAYNALINKHRESIDSLNKQIDGYRNQISELSKTTEVTDRALNALTSAVQREKSIKEEQLRLLEEEKNAIESLISSIDNSIKVLRSASEPVNTMLVQQANAVISSAVSGTKYSPDKLLEAVGVSVNAVQTDVYATKVDQERANLLLSNQLEELNKVNKNSLSNVTSQITLMQNQITQLDSIIENATKQVNSLRGIDTSTMNIDTAMSYLNDSVAKEQSAIQQIKLLETQIAQAESQILGIEALIQQATTDYENAVKQYEEMQKIDSSIKGLGETFKEAIDKLIEAISKNQGVSEVGGTDSTAEIPAFASGGRYQGGMALVGEQGPELINFNKPGMVYNSTQTAGILSGDGELADKVQRLAEAVEMLRYEARATAVNTSKMAKQLDRTSDQGDTIRVTVVA